MFQKIKTRFQNGLNFSKKATITPRRKLATFIKTRPFITLFSLLGLLVLLIVISNSIQKPKVEEENVAAKTKTVEVYRIGAAPKLKVQAQVEKSGVVTISALAPGVVQQILVEPGTVVTQGQTLISTSSNYQGGNAASLQKQLAARQLQNINETYDTQKDLIKKQRDLASKTEEDDEQLRDITDDSFESTRDLISLNDEILSNIDAGIAGSTTPSQISELKGMKSQFLAANNQLKSALRSAEYTTADTSPPANIADINKDISMKQLDLQEKALDLTRDITRLQFQQAQVQEAAMYPSAPFNATVQRVFVNIGDQVNPGTPLLVLSQTIEEDPIVAIAYVPREIATKVSYMEPSTLTIGKFTYEAYPSYVTQDAINGSLYGVYFPIPDMYHKQLTNDGYISVQMPVGYFDTGVAVPYVPIESVFQTQSEAYVFVEKNGKAKSKKIVLGEVLGRYVEVENGLEKGDVIILNRTVVAGDLVKIQ